MVAPRTTPNPSLTGIRGAAAAWVFAYHLVAISGSTGHRINVLGVTFAEAGYLGVDLFFLLSGFILTGAHVTEFTRLSSQSFQAFYKARFWRIYPPSIAALLLISLLFAADRPLVDYISGLRPGGLTPASWLVTATLATRWGLQVSASWNEPIWSLSAEVLAYAVFPLLAFSAARIRSTRLLYGLVIAPLLLLLGVQHWPGGWWANSIDESGALARVACCFVAGMALKLVCDAQAEQLRPWVGVAGTASAVGLIVTVCAFITHRNIAIIFFPGLLLSCALRKGPIHALMSGRIMLFLGAISFPFYLLHLNGLAAIGVFARDRAIHGWPYLALCVAATAGLLWLSALGHRWVEQPAHRRARRSRRSRPIPEPARAGQPTGR